MILGALFDHLYAAAATARFTVSKSPLIESFCQTVNSWDPITVVRSPVLPSTSWQVLEKTPSTVMDKPLEIDTAKMHALVVSFIIGNHLFAFDLNCIGPGNRREWPPHFHCPLGCTSIPDKSSSNSITI